MPSSTGLHDFLAAHPSFQHPRSSSSALPSLYSDLSRQRKTNPAGYRANIEWWRDILTDVTWQGVQLDQPTPKAERTDAEKGQASTSGSSSSLPSRTVFHLDEGTKIRWTVPSVGRPLGLGTVVSELETSHHVTPLARFLQSNAPINGPQARGLSGGLRAYVPSVGTVASALLLSPAKWAASQIGLPIGSVSRYDDDSDYSEDEMLFRRKKGDYVVYENVSRLTSAFLQHHWTTSSLSPLANLLTTAEFNEKLSAVCSAEYSFVPNEQDVQVVLRHLTRDCGGVATSQRGVVKLASSELDPIATDITEEDRGVLAVKTTHRQLEAQIVDLEAKIADRNTRIKAYLSANQKPQALSYLRSRKALQELLTRRMGTLETLTGVLLKIEQAKGDVEIVKSYRTSSTVLDSILANPELKMDNVDSTVAKLEDSLAAHQQVDDALRDVGQSGTQIDEDEIQDELEALLQEQQDKSTKVPKQADKPTQSPAQSDQLKQQQEDEELRHRLERLRVPLSDQPEKSVPSTANTDTARSASPIRET